MDNEYIKTQAAGLNALSSANKAKSQLLSQANKGTTSAGHVYSKMKEIVGYNKRPKSTLHALLDGLFTGFEIHEKGKHYQTLQKGVDFLTRQQEAVNKDLLMEAQEQEKKQMISPYADSAYNITQSGLSPEQQHQSFTKLVNQVVTAGLLPQGSAFVATAGPNGFLFTPPGAESPEYFNYGKYISKEAQAFVKQNFDQGIQQQNAEAHMMSAKASHDRAGIAQKQLDMQQDPKSTLNQLRGDELAVSQQNSNFSTSTKAKAEQAGKVQTAKENAKVIHKIYQDMHNGDEHLQRITEMRNIISSSDKAGSDPWTGVVRWWAEKTGDTFDADTIGQNMLGYLKDLKTIYGGVISDNDIKTAEKTWPKLSSNKQAVLNSMDKTITNVTNKINLYRQQIELFDEDNAANLYSNKANTSTPRAVPHQQGTQEKMYTVETPDGEKRMIPESMIEKAIAQGGKVFG